MAAPACGCYRVNIDVRQTGDHRDADEQALLGLLPADGSPADSTEIRSRLAGTPGAMPGLRPSGRAGLRAERAGPRRSACRDLTAVPPEFRPACGRPGSHVIVRQVPVTIPHAICDLTGVRLSCPGHGGAAVTAPPGHVIMNNQGFRLKVDARTLDVTITVTGHEGNA